MDNYDTGIYTDNPDDTLRYMRSTQAVAVTRCKDCKYQNARTKNGKNVHCNMFSMWMENEFFCAYGKKG